MTQFVNFFSTTIAERTGPGQRQSVQENDYTAHAYKLSGNEQLTGKSIVFRRGAIPVCDTESP